MTTAQGEVWGHPHEAGELPGRSAFPPCFSSQTSELDTRGRPSDGAGNSSEACIWCHRKEGGAPLGVGGCLQGVRSWHTDQPSVFRVPPPTDPTGSTRRNTEPDLLCRLQTAQGSRAWGLPFDASQPWTWPPWKEEDFQRRTFPVSRLRESLAVSTGLESECAQGDAAAAQRSLHRTPLSPEVPRPTIRDQPARMVLSALITREFAL